MSDHFENGRFFNPNGANGQPIWKAPRMLFERGTPWPAQVPVVQRTSLPPTSGDEMSHFAGHATFDSDERRHIYHRLLRARAGPFAAGHGACVSRAFVSTIASDCLHASSHNTTTTAIETLRALQHRDIRAS
jgi:hypothetical protein